MDHRLTPDMLERLDEHDDALFYTLPRKLVHIDDGAIAAADESLSVGKRNFQKLVRLVILWRHVNQCAYSASISRRYSPLASAISS